VEHWQAARKQGAACGVAVAVFYLKGGVIEAALPVNDDQTGRRSRELIRRRVQVDSQALSDLATDLRELT
jgi:hypothetical protein